jgi:hypothetical protein
MLNSFVLNKYENNFNILIESYKTLHNKLKNNENYKEKHIDLLNIILSNSNELLLNMDRLSLMIVDDDYELNKYDLCKINNIKHQEKVFKKIAPLFLLIDNFVRTESK